MITELSYGGLGSCLSRRHADLELHQFRARFVNQQALLDVPREARAAKVQLELPPNSTTCNIASSILARPRLIRMRLPNVGSPSLASESRSRHYLYARKQANGQHGNRRRTTRFLS